MDHRPLAHQLLSLRTIVAVQEDVLLAEPQYDATRASALLRRVAEEADRLELIHLLGHDQPLGVFRKELLREGGSQE